MFGLTLQMTLEVINTACVMVVVAYMIIRADPGLLDAGRQTGARTLVKLSMLFGAFSLYGAFNAIHAFEAVISLRHTGAIVGGFIAGPWVGLGAGLIGAIDRYLQGGPSAWSAVLAVILAGTLAGLYLRYINRNRIPGIAEAAFFTALYEMGAGYLTLLYVPDFTRAWQIESGIRIPLVVGNAIAVALFIGCVKILAQERDLRQSRERAEAATRAKSDFLAQISHEIRNPLNLVLGQAQLLAREPLAPHQQAMVRRIHDAGDSLLFILNDLLDLAKIEAGHLLLEPRPCDLARLSTRLAELMAPLAQAKGLALRVTGPPPGEELLSLDGHRLLQVLTNLVHNAIKFTDRGEVALRLQTQRLSETSVRLHCEVQDPGGGIATKDLPLLFTPFTQGEAGVQYRSGGTGLGLAICKWLVELMGGTIEVRSQPGQGTTFWFEVNCEIATGALGDQGEVSGFLASCHPGPEPRLVGSHFLVVDDSEENLEVVAQVLKREGAQVSLALDGQEALDRLHAAPEAFTAVLMDLQMPVLDGLSATRLIRAEPALASLPIIALTANALQAHRQAALAAGMNEVLTKPFNLDLMVSMLAQWAGPRQPVGPAVGPAGGEADPAVATSTTPVPGRPVTGKLVPGNSVIVTPVSGRLVVEMPAAGRSVTEMPANSSSVIVTSTAGKPVTVTPTSARSGTEMPAAVIPVSHPPSPSPSPSSSPESHTFPFIPGLDREQAARALCGNEAMLMDFLERFATRYGNLIEALRAGLADGDGDPKAVARQLHQLRGFAANFGALGVVRGARMLEEALLRGDDPRPEEWAELEDQIRIVIDASAPWRQALDQPMGQARSKITAPPAPA